MNPLRATLALGAALLAATLVLATAPTASAHVEAYRIDLNGDGDCNDPYETLEVEAPLPGNHHLAHRPCVLI